MKPLASIVILCHNDRSYLKGCVASLRRHTRIPHELIFVDNASSDGVREDLRVIRRTYPFPVKLILNRENRFFSGGNNQGLRSARGRHVVLLNADTLVTPGWLEGMIAAAEEDPRVGLVGPCTNQAAGLQVIWPPAYRTPRELPAWARRWASENRGSRLETPLLVFFCVLAPRDVLEKIGTLDEGYGPGGFEDYDLCLRARLAGYRLVVARDVYVHHYGGRGYVNMPYEEMRERNRDRFWDKWDGWCRDRLDRRPEAAGVRA
jgi:GT2 family glycosyltransferase